MHADLTEEVRIPPRAEVEQYVKRFRDQRDADGRRLVVRNGTARPRPVVTGAGTLEVAAPRINAQSLLHVDAPRAVCGPGRDFKSSLLDM